MVTAEQLSLAVPGSTVTEQGAPAIAVIFAAR
jgi:hypothetical protein